MKRAAAYKGHETFHNAIRMSMKMYLNTLFWFMIIHLSLILLITAWWYQEPISQFFHHINTDLNGHHLPDANDVQAFFSWLWNRILIVSALSSVLWLFYPVVLGFFKRRAQKQSERIHLRGARLVTPKEIHRQMKRNKEQTSLQIGEVRFPESAEVKHALVLGRPGVGKTLLLSRLIEQLMVRGNKGIIYDFKGDYVERFYRPGRDLLFNPVDERCLPWNVFNEMKTVTDIHAIAHSLIPPARQADPFWNDGARDVFTGLLHSLYQRNLRTNAEIWKAVSAPSRDISAWLDAALGAESGHRYVEDPTSKQTMSILSVMMQFVKCFELLSKMEGDFRISQWIEQGEGWIFVTNDAQTADTLRPMISLFIDLLGRRLLSLPEDEHRRIFFILDEFGTLQSLPAVVQLLKLSRSKGGSIWLGIQDVGQIDNLYGESLRQTIVNACRTAAIFSVSDPKTAKFLSAKIGETEFSEIEETYSMGVDDHRDGVSLIRRRRVEPLILPSEIMQLEDLELFLQLPTYGLTRTHLTWKSFPARAKALQFRQDLELDRIMTEQHAIQRQAERITDMDDQDGRRPKKNFNLEIEEDMNP
jgi:type IV conjugative transfer system coupling protein TraD